MVWMQYSQLIKEGLWSNNQAFVALLGFTFQLASFGIEKSNFGIEKIIRAK